MTTCIGLFRLIQQQIKEVHLFGANNFQNAMRFPFRYSTIIRFKIQNAGPKPADTGTVKQAYAMLAAGPAPPLRRRMPPLP
jgi:hypothetical protein